MKKIILVIVCIAVSLMVWSQNQDCKRMYDGAMEYYKKGEYAQAAKMFTRVKESCGSFLDCEAKLRECNKVEDAEYNRCTSISACDSYLAKYPNGRYVSDVKAKKQELLNLNAENKEEADYKKCASIEDCDRYLKNYPNGKYVSEVKQKKADFMEESLAEKAYMDIRNVEFANLDVNGNVINATGSPLNSTDMKILTPTIVYNGLKSGKYITLNIKMIAPDGKLKYDSNSPSGYTYSVSFMVESGYHKQQVLGWGSSSRSAYIPGNYVFEIWCKENCLYRKNFSIAGKSSDGGIESTGDVSYSNGFYKGQMKNGKPHGYGLYYWNSGELYVGEWSEGQKSGNGIYVSTERTIRNCPKCTFYVGSWADDVKSGTGTCYDLSGKLLYYGKFSNDRPTAKYPDSAGGGAFKFKILHYSNDLYWGETVKGSRDGKGIYMWESGEIWYGKWHNGTRNGFGFYVDKDGEITTGTWKDGVKQ